MHVAASLAQTFREHAARPALVAADGTVSYGELAGLAAGIRRRLGRRAADEPIGVFTGDDVGTYAAILAILASGAAYVPLNRRNPAARNRLIVESAGLEIVLASRASAELDALVAASSGRFEIVYTEGLSSIDALDFEAVEPEHLAYLFFTSGTTGVPKGVPIRHRNLDAFMTALLEHSAYGFGRDDRFLQMFELTFDLSVMSLLTPLCLGASCHVVPETGIAYLNIVRLLEEREISVALMVPSVLSYLRRYFAELSFPALRQSLFCGEALAHELTAEWARCIPAAEIRNVYGPTEATIFCTEFKWEESISAEQSVNDIVPIGVAMAGTLALVADDSGRLLPSGDRGELYLIGDQLTTGYWGDTARSLEAFTSVTVDGEPRRAYRSGDICFVNEHGNLIYCGRRDAQIQIDGHRVELAEVEHHLRAYLDGANAVAVPVRSADGRQELVAFLESAADPSRDALAYLGTRLPAYMLPRRTICVPVFPVNLNGKIDRKALLERYLKNLE